MRASKQLQAGLEPHPRLPVGRIAIERLRHRIKLVMHRTRPPSITGFGRSPAADHQFRHDPGEADLAAGRADEIARHEVFVSRAEHDELRPQFPDQSDIPFVGCDLPR